jgi:hypothetical protein
MARELAVEFRDQRDAIGETKLGAGQVRLASNNKYLAGCRVQKIKGRVGGPLTATSQKLEM